MLIVTGTVEVDAGSVDAIEDAAVKMAQASRGEEGCHGYAFYRDLENPLRFRVYEQWTDEAALAFHFQTPHMADFRKALAGVKITAMDVNKFQAGPMSPVT